MGKLYTVKEETFKNIADEIRKIIYTKSQIDSGLYTLDPDNSMLDKLKEINTELDKVFNTLGYSRNTNTIYQLNNLVNRHIGTGSGGTVADSRAITFSNFPTTIPAGCSIQGVFIDGNEIVAKEYVLGKDITSSNITLYPIANSIVWFIGFDNITDLNDNWDSEITAVKMTEDIDIIFGSKEANV